MSLPQNEAHLADGIIETPVTIPSGGTSLRGILTLPEKEPPTQAILFSHGWSGNRNGPAGLLTFLARSLAIQGCACLRFDFRGRGESGGNGLESSLSTMSEDLKQALHFLETRTHLPHPLLLGMCSGGNVAIGSLEKIPEVKELVLLSVYPFSDGDSFGRDMNRTFHFLKVYFQKATSLKTWKRVLTGEASLGRALGVLLRPFLKHGENKKKETGAQPAAPASKLVKASANESRLANGKEPPKKYLLPLKKNGIRALMIYGTADPDAKAAIRYYGDFVAKEGLPIIFQSIEGANHNYSTTVWHKQLLAFIQDFIHKYLNP